MSAKYSKIHVQTDSSECKYRANNPTSPEGEGWPVANPGLDQVHPILFTKTSSSRVSFLVHPSFSITPPHLYYPEDLSLKVSLGVVGRACTKESEPSRAESDRVEPSGGSWHVGGRREGRGLLGTDAPRGEGGERDRVDAGSEWIGGECRAGG